VEVYLIRHTKPEIEKGICYGQSDLTLADTFDAEWKAIQTELPDGIDVIFTSPLQRCMQLATRLSTHYGLKAHTDVRLMEMNFGNWEMKRWDEIDQQQLTSWMANYMNEQCPRGESYSDVRSRLCSFLGDRVNDQARQYMLVTHGGIIKCFHGLVSGGSGMDLSVGYGERYYFNGRIPVEDW